MIQRPLILLAVSFLAILRRLCQALRYQMSVFIAKIDTTPGFEYTPDR